MKKTSIALLIGLIAMGCEKAAPKQTAPPDITKMGAHMGTPPGLGSHGAAGEKKDDEKKTEGDSTPAATEEPKADEPKTDEPK